MGGVKVVIIRPRYDLSSSDDEDHLIGLGYLYLISWNVRVAPILIDDTRGEFKCVSPHNCSPENWIGKFPHTISVTPQIPRGFFFFFFFFWSHWIGNQF